MRSTFRVQNGTTYLSDIGLSKSVSGSSSTLHFGCAMNSHRRTLSSSSSNAFPFRPPFAPHRPRTDRPPVPAVAVGAGVACQHSRSARGHRMGVNNGGGIGIGGVKFRHMNVNVSASAIANGRGPREAQVLGYSRARRPHPRRQCLLLGGIGREKGTTIVTAVRAPTRTSCLLVHLNRNLFLFLVLLLPHRHLYRHRFRHHLLLRRYRRLRNGSHGQRR